MTPHTAYCSQEAEEDLRILNMNNILDVLEDRTLPRTLLNPGVKENARFLQEAEE